MLVDFEPVLDRMRRAARPADEAGRLAQVAELVDAQVSGTCGATRGSSSLLLGTISSALGSFDRRSRCRTRFAKPREWRQDGADERIDR
jgi:hypothetical protein